MTLNSDGKFKEKVLCGFKYYIKNLVNFHPTTQNYENIFSMVSFCPRYTSFELQKYRGVIFHDTEQWCKIWIDHDLAVWKATWRIWFTFIRALKSLKNRTLMGFLSKVYNVSVRNFYRNYVSWLWKVMQNLKENWVVASKMTCEIWLIFMRAVKGQNICPLMRLFCLKHIKF